MSVFTHFKMQPLCFALKLLSTAPFLLVSEYSLAKVINGGALDIDSSTAVFNYELINDATLNANGATTEDITVRGSTLNFTVSNVQSSGRTGVNLQNSKATITGSTISSDQIGLVLSHDSTASQGSIADVIGSTITSVGNGATINALSVLNLSGSTITATGANAVGLRLFNGTVIASKSVISGVKNGIRINFDPSLSARNTLVLTDNSHVEGLAGSAILVDGSIPGTVEADITVRNQSTLTGSNGTLMEVIAGAEGNLTVDNSDLIGNIVADGTSTANVTLQNLATLTGKLDNVQNLAVNSNARWIMDANGSIENLSLSGGGVQFGKPGNFYSLSVANLSGPGGTFYMYNNFTTGQISTLTVIGNASGNHLVALESSGTEPVAAGSTPVVHIGAGDASFALAGGRVSLGAFDYDLIKHGNNDWYLDTTSRVISPGTQSVLALFNAAPTVWYGELSTLRSRMGDIRMNQGHAGGWMRAYGNKFGVSASSGVGYQQNQQGISFGADAPLPLGDGQWLVGLMGGYSKSDLDLSGGTSGTVNSYYLGAYSTWMDQQSGYYFDGVLKFNRFQNESKVQLSDGTQTKGRYDNNGVGASLEFGRHITLANEYFVEPFTQLSGLVVGGKNYHLDNDLSAEGDNTHSLLAKVGATAGRNFNLGEGKVVQPYVRAAYVHEFANNNKVEVNNNVFNNDLSGSRGELGAGIAVTLTDKVSVHADFDYSNGDKIEQPWGANVGVRYSW